eukprot:jgi/Tetstr1/463164/TSEL_008098.t1
MSAPSDDGGEPVGESRVRNELGKLHGSGPARRGVAPAAAWTVSDAFSIIGVAAGAAWAPRIDAAARSLQPAPVKHHPADVMAFAEVASMYLQGRLPGWFSRLFASAKLASYVKMLGEGGAPDVRLVAVWEAERRVSERAVVDNMNAAYVSLLAPS